MKEYQKYQGVKIRSSQEPTPVAAWLEEGKRRFGEDALQRRFVCPMCHKEYSVQEFIDAGGKGGPYQECIGRYLGAGSPGAPDGNPNGCNWVAYGLLGCAGKGRLIQADDGHIVEAFHFAEVEKEAEQHGEKAL